MMQFNPATLKAWWAEQILNDKPIPGEELVKVFTKSRAKINKK